MSEKFIKAESRLTQSMLFRLLPAQMIMPAMTSVISIANGIIAGQYIEERAVGVVGLYSVILRIIEAITLVLLAGSVVMCGRSMGEGNIEKTDNIFSVNLIVTFFLAVGITLVELFFASPLAAVLGATGDLALQLEKYIRGMAIGVFPFMMGRQLSSFLQLERRSERIYAAISVMLVSNVALDILFVVFMKMGIQGLALATSISNWLYFLVMVSYYFTKNAQLHFTFSSKGFQYLLKMVSIGASEAVLSFAFSIENLLMNRIILAYAGESALSAFASVMMAMQLIISYAMGVGNALRSLASISLGEKDKDALIALKRVVIRKALPLSFAVAVGLIIITFPLPSLYFQNGSEAFKLARSLFLIMCSTEPLLLILFSISNYLQAKEHRVYCSILSIYDGLCSALIPAMILAPSMGVTGIWISSPIGYVTTFLLSAIYCIIYNRGIPRTDEQILFLKPGFGASEKDRFARDIKSIKDVEKLSMDVNEFCLKHDMSAEDSNHAAVCIEELASNVIIHGFTKDKKKNHLIQVRVVYDSSEKEPSLILRIKDDCVRFNPQERASQTRGNDIEKNLGIKLVMNVAKEVTYQSFIGLNVLTIRL